ncbi:MAG: hypothetical protein AB7D02_01995, partial [Candidatus Paceibacterota bacterium]
LLALFSFSFYCFALEEPPMNFTDTAPSNIEVFGEKGALIMAVNWFFNIVIIIGIIFIIFAGFKYVTSGGDPNNTKKAMTILVYALIGIAIALLAKALIVFVGNWLKGGTGFELNVPGL